MGRHLILTCSPFVFVFGFCFAFFFFVFLHFFLLSSSNFFFFYLFHFHLKNFFLFKIVLSIDYGVKEAKDNIPWMYLNRIRKAIIKGACAKLFFFFEILISLL